MDSKIKAALRRAFYYNYRYQALKAHKTPEGLYRCYICQGEFESSKDVDVEHRHPVVDPTVGFVDWNTYIARMFCDLKDLPPACKPCHKAKTASESGARRAAGTGAFSPASRIKAAATRARKAAKKKRKPKCKP